MTNKQQKTFKEFHKTTSSLLNALASLSEEQINFSPKKGWSAGQIGEHILKSYASVQTLNGNTEKTVRPFDQKLEPIKTLFLDTSIKMDSPEAILPSKKKIVKKDLIKALEDRIEQIKEVIINRDLSLTCIDFSIPEYGEFTRFEWVWFNIYHTQRHLHQLENRIALNNGKERQSK
ncbi:DinB family protein [uncultured Marixanthomonas sp.]|uniref:DinB family protein n=1 Tax=uncultured Marixanthomonas sp. TaxID=757245 RepID=UPI0030D97004|tara:strand:+ start:7923 stop:8450 length:528 start_codon:yes stop_codon:yes gene_type:complete